MILAILGRLSVFVPAQGINHSSQPRQDSVHNHSHVVLFVWVLVRSHLVVNLTHHCHIAIQANTQSHPTKPELRQATLPTIY